MRTGAATALDHAYDALLKKGRLLPNPSQAALIHRLSQLQLSLSQTKTPSSNGLYIHGSVGTGKSYLASLFTTTLASSITRRRAHFHEFMLDVHARLHRARSVSSRYDSADPLPVIGRQLCAEHRVLCFDEFQVTDIADATILQRLMGAFWSAGGVMVATSNRKPEGLYENGINRGGFLPFIELLKQRCEVWQLDGAQDYRMLGVPAGRKMRQVFFTDLDSFEESLVEATGGREIVVHSVPVMMGRKLAVTATHSENVDEGLVVSSTFELLCEARLGAADYHALCQASEVIYLRGLRRLSLFELDFARRLITLIDLAYESGTRIIIYSHVTIDEAFAEIVDAERQRQQRALPAGLQMSVRKGGGSSSSMMSTYVSGDVEWSATGLAKASLATGGAGETDVGFAIGRAISRLHEMGSPVYGQVD
jgi:protein AFG1